MALSKLHINLDLMSVQFQLSGVVTHYVNIWRELSLNSMDPIVLYM